MNYELYEVGGRVRDKFLGVDSKDVDYSVVVHPSWSIMPVDEVFERFVTQIKSEGFKVFVETPDCFTVRAKFPKGHVHEGLDADFVLARKEEYYDTSSRKPVVELGSLHDDLSRRDFTVNAMAETITGEIVDPFNGQRDLMLRTLKTPHNTVESFNDDPLRILRAFRFCITKGFDFSDDIVNAIKLFHPDKMRVVSQERISSELFKMFKHDTVITLRYLRWLEDMNPYLFKELFKDGLWLMPTNKK